MVIRLSVLLIFYRLADLCATGVLKKLRNTWFKQQIKTEDNIRAIDPFGFDNTRVAFMLLAAGIALACVILCCEILADRKRKHDLKVKPSTVQTHLQFQWNARSI